jgi:hypothetical protein
MIKKRSKQLAILAILLLGLGYWIVNRRASLETVSHSQRDQTNNASPPTRADLGSGTKQSIVTNNGISPRAEEKVEATERINDRWRTPILFYGKAIDEHGTPVSNAEVQFEWNNLMGTSAAKTQTSADGQFSFVGKEGYVLTVKVSKAGYYSLQPAAQAFYYNRGGETHIADVHNPVVFHLQKHGPVEDLKVFERTLQLSSSGRPIELELSTGQIVSTGIGDLRLEFVRETNVLSAERPIFTWRFLCTAVTGGLVVSTNPFAFRAPDGGYTRNDLVEMNQARQSEWKGRLERQYFYRAAGGTHSRLIVDLMAHNGSLRVKIFHNPNGSQNLEYRGD